MLYLRHDFCNIMFKIKHKLYMYSGSAPPSPSEKLWVATCFFAFFPFMSRHFLSYCFRLRPCSFLPCFVILISHFILPPSFLSFQHSFLSCTFHILNRFSLSLSCLPSLIKQSNGRSLRVPSGTGRNCRLFCNATHVCADSMCETFTVFWKWHRVVTWSRLCSPDAAPLCSLYA